MRFLVNDTETCGLHPPAPPASGVVEVAYLDICPETLETSNHCVSRVNPGCDIGPKASEVHGIYNDDVLDCPSLSEVFSMTGPVVSIGHNTSFDLKFLGMHYENLVGSICTLSLAREFIPEAPNHKLSTLQAYLGLPENKAHSALGDVLTTVDLLRHISKISGITLKEFLARSKTPKVIHVMPFGAHKGKSIMSLPASYIQWMLQQDILPDLRNSLNLALKAK